jgi:predicted dienelactone hydrolase
MLQSIAAAGYLVLSIDHPYDADVVEFPNGTLVTEVDISTDAEVELAVTTRVKDMMFVHQQLSNSSAMAKILPGFLRGRRTPKVAVVGHSLGGAAAAAAMVAMPSVRGGVNLDGTMFGSVLTTGFDRPFMLIGHENKTQETDPSWKAIWPKLTGWKRELEVKKAAHYSFSDLPIITSSLGLQSQLPAEVGQVLGTIEGRRMAGLTVTYVTAFLDKVLKDSSNGILDGKSKEYPEVVRVA